MTAGLLVALLLAAPAADAATPAVADLDAASRRYAAAIPLPLATPIELVVEPDYATMAKRLGEIGETVVAQDGSVHLVVPAGGATADDLDAFRFGVARALVRRTGLAADRPWLADGAAAWLVGRWQGRPLGDWPGILAATGTLPSAADLLAATKAADSSDVLWIAAAAAVVERLPGADLAAKLEPPPSEPRIGALLDGFRRVAPRPRPGAGEAPALPAGAFYRGVSFAMLNGVDVGYHAPSVDGELTRLAGLGTDAVALMPFAYQPAPDRPEMRFLNRHPAAETDVGLLHAARRARARGMRVLWKPHVWVGHGSWPGEIAMADEAGWTAWWKTYRRFVVHHAVLAERAGAELFSIGVELGKTGARREWLELVAAVRQVYSGPLVYSANWWGDYDRFPFWDRLDLVGVDAYFPLAAADADPEAVREGARRVVATLADAARRFGKPILLTEVGFAARPAAWAEPHHEGGTVSLPDQAFAYDALLTALGRPDWLAGVFVWKAFTADGADARDDADFRFLGRPAENVVRRYFALNPSAARPPGRPGSP